MIPLMRDLRAFPPPANDAEAAIYAEGFAWAMQGVADDVIATLCTMLPGVLVAKLPEAREAFASRCSRVWGDVAVGATRTSLPG